MDDFLKKAGIKLLKDEGVLIDNSFYVYGRPDAYKRGNTKKQRKSPMEITKNMDREKPIIMIDHQPKELQEMADAGVDLDLSGHTHDGQYSWEFICKTNVGKILMVICRKVQCTTL